MSQRAKVIAAMLTMYIVWGTTYLAIKVGLDAALPPALFSAMRLLPAGVILFGLAALRRVPLRLDPREMRITTIVGILLLVGGQYGTVLAEQTTPSGVSALVVALVPLWIALAESFFPDMHRPGLLGWLGLAIGFTGLAILVWPMLTGVDTSTAAMVGLAIQVIATWVWTAGSIYSKRNPVHADGMVVTGWEMLAAGSVTLIIGTVLGEWNDLVLTPKGVAAIAYLTVFGSCIAFTAFLYALKHLPASKVMTYAYVNPVIAVFAGYAAGTIGLVPPEPITATTLTGMVVIIAGVALTTTAPTLPPRVTSDRIAPEATALSADVEPSET